LLAEVKKMPASDRMVAQEVALTLESMFEQISAPARVPERKEIAKPKKRALSSFKMEEDDQIRRALSKRKEEKEEAKKKEK
jgi:pilus assembly protein TadC